MLFIIISFSKRSIEANRESNREAGREADRLDNKDNKEGISFFRTY